MKKNILILLISFLSFNLISQVTPSGGGISGSGTTNYLPKFTASKKLGNSVLYQLSNDLGVSTTFPDAKFDIYQNSFGSNKKIFNVSYFGKASIFYIDDSAKVRFPVLNANTVPYINSVNALASSTVTPTKLNYLDATSSIQTQLNEIRQGRKYFAYDNTTYSYTGTTASTILRTIYIPAGTMGLNSTLELYANFGKSGTAGTMGYYAYATTSPTTVTGGFNIKACQLAAGSLQGGFVLRFTNKNSLNSQSYQLPNPAAAQFDTWQSTNFAKIIGNIDFSVDQYIHIFTSLASAADTGIIYDYQCYIDKP